MTFAPIAIVGQACLLPGAASSAELTRAALEGRDLLSDAPRGRWRVDPERILCGPDRPRRDASWSSRGGYVEGFDRLFDPGGFLLPADELSGLDPVFLWVLHTAREALRSAGFDGPLPLPQRGRGALIMGNLSFPTDGLTRLAESIWKGRAGLEAERVDPRNRFSSSLPAHLSARALGLDARAFALDAACASSLYAIKLACDLLHDGAIDLAVAGAVNKTDDLFIHVGFCALQAMSRTGQSRPFHRDADGLVPAEGAAFVALRRLDDALARGERVLGVIRGVGLSNDGRGAGGMLAPSSEGQVRAMEAAYRMAGLTPADVGLIECHATGTPVGDATELKSMDILYNGLGPVPIGSLKSNMGHLITAAGAAGLQKVLGAMAAGELPPTLHADLPTEALDGSPFRLVHRREPWSGPRRAAVSAFGFGGNNAHLLVEAPPEPARAQVAAALGAPPSGDLAVVACAAMAAGASSTEALRAGLMAGKAMLRPRGAAGGAGHLDEITLPLQGLRFPPRDLALALPQQLAMLKVGREALAEAGPLPTASTSVLVGMECDPEIARYGGRWRAAEWAREAGADEAWLTQAQDAFAAPLEAAGVLGTMPNIPANRLNSQFALGGPSFTVASGEPSGLEALRIAARALRAREIDAALVGASDFSVELVHEEACRAAGQAAPAGDAAVALVLRRLDDARRDGNPILAVIPAEPGDADPQPDLHPRTGKAHAATGLVHAVAAVESLASAASPAPGGPRPHLPSPTPRSLLVRASTSLGFSGEVTLRADALSPRRPLLLSAPPAIHVFAGADRAEVRRRLDAGHPGGEGPCKLALVASSDDELRARVEAARAALGGDASPLSPAEGVFFRERPLRGQVAFVFGGPASIYAGMGRELVLALPGLVDRLGKRFRRVDEVAGWVYDGGDLSSRLPVEKLWAASFLMQLHGELTRHALGLEPAAYIGISSGETNALFASGAWHDLDGMFDDIDRSGLYSRELAGEFRAARVAWGLGPEQDVRWVNHRILAPLAQVQQALAGETRAHLTIIHSPHDVVIGGDTDACRRVLERVGPERARALGYDLVVHSAELAPFRDGWWSLHRRPTQQPAARIYSHGKGGSYALSDDAVADALTAQAMATVDFPALVRRAHDDGVRVFLEHGPHDACCRWIDAILDDRDHAAIPLDRAGEDPVRQAVHAAAALLVCGVPVHHERLTSLLSEAHRRCTPPPTPSPSLSFPAHRPPPAIPPLPTRTTMQIMAPAPALPSTFEAPQTTQPAASPQAADQVTAPVPPAAPLAPAAPAAPAPPVASPPASAPQPARHAPAAASPAPQPARRDPAPAAAPTAAAPPTAPAAPAAPAAPSAPTAAPGAPLAASPLALAAAQPGAPLAGRAGSVLAIQRSAASVHRTFLEQQGALHRRFLSLQPSLALSGQHAAAPQTAPQAPRPAQPAAPAQPRPPTPPAAVAPARAPAAPAPAAPGPAAMASAAAPTAAPVAAVALVTRAPEPPAASIAAPRQAPQPAIAQPAASQPAASQPAASQAPRPEGPSFSRQDLEVLASGKISQIFGPLFEQQDGYERQVRMPMPPLLLADRVTGIKGEPGSMKLGTIWTETDITWDAWYLNEGRMPGGIMIESGQADLLLISWLGADFLNKSERIYRLLGCELRYHDRLPKPGETLCYDIHVDGHAKHDDVRLFFFHYDCRVNGDLRLSVRQGQAGFFTEQELANSGGILWEPETGECTPNPRLDQPRTPVAPSYTREQLDALSEGRPWDCFGPSQAMARSHVRTPRTGAGRLQLFDAVTHLDTGGGPWKRGYLRAVQKISPEDWYFTGHFKNDPCMPGTLMFEGCQQIMAFYLLALGFGLDADGWTFEPVPDETYKLRCRGQVIPTSKELVYELFIDEVIDGPVPTLYADLLCTVDGLKAFHCRRMGMRLAPDWPMDRIRELRDMPADTHPAADYRGFRFDQRSLIACAWGKPTEAFGPMYQVFDGHRRTPRLPGPPYHFVSRIARIDGDINVVAAGTTIEAHYDVPPDAWYFDENGAATMPYCVLLEATLQPCGWLASATGVTAGVEQDLSFRNLDGTATWHSEVRRGAGTLRTTTKLRSLSRSAGMVIVGFDVACHQGDTLVYDMKTVFGFFPKEALANQVGLQPGDEAEAWLDKPSDYRVDLKQQPARFFNGSARIAAGKLRMIDRLSGYWPEGGAAGLGRMRAEKDIDPGEWFFKAHFFQDPVQPGSLGIEAMIQVLQAYMLQRGLDRGMRRPRFEPLALGKALTWKYRGQVVPRNKLVTTEIEVTEVTRDERGVTAVASAWLWVDGLCIYGATGLAMRIVDDGSADPAGPPSARGGAEPAPTPGGAEPAPARSEPAASSSEVTLSPARDGWINDHRPTYTVPALPAMYMIDRLATAASRALPPGSLRLQNAQIRRWAPAPGDLATRDVIEPAGPGLFRARFEVFREATDPRLSRFEVAAEAELSEGAEAAPAPFADLTDAVSQPDPYASGHLFHGRAFQLLTALRLGPSGASADLDLDAAPALGALNFILLDAATHAIPHDRLHLWFAGVDPGMVGYPARIPELSVFGPAPQTGKARVEVRADGFDGDPRFVRFQVQIVYGGSVWCRFTLVEALFPKGPLGSVEPAERRAFLQRQKAGPSLSRVDGAATRLDPAAVAASNWLPGTVEAAYGASAGGDLSAEVAIKEHLGRKLGVHPSAIEVSGGEARCPTRPLRRLPFALAREGDEIVVSSPQEPALDTSGPRAFWRERLESDTPPVADLYLGLAERFVGDVVLEDPADLARLRGKSVVFLGNHQVAIESPLFSMLVSSLIEGVVVTIAKMEHKTGWLGRLIAHSFSYPDSIDPENIVYFDRADKESLLGLAQQMGAAMMQHKKSILVHVEGTRALSSEARVEKISSIWCDVALTTDSPIVPVRFAHALPQSTPERLEFPVGYGKQSFYLGKAIWPDELQKLPLPDRKRRVLEAINSAGPAVDTPTTPDPEFVAAVEQWRRRTGATEPQAVLLLALERHPTACQQTRDLVRAIHAGRLDLPATPEGVWLRGLARQLA